MVYITDSVEEAGCAWLEELDLFPSLFDVLARLGVDLPWFKYSRLQQLLENEAVSDACWREEAYLVWVCHRRDRLEAYAIAKLCGGAEVARAYILM